MKKVDIKIHYAIYELTPYNKGLGFINTGIISQTLRIVHAVANLFVVSRRFKNI